MFLLSLANTDIEKKVLLVLAIIILLFVALALFTAVTTHFHLTPFTYNDIIQIAGSCTDSTCVTSG